MAGGKPLRRSGGVTWVIGWVKYAWRLTVAGPSTVSAAPLPGAQRHGRQHGGSDHADPAPTSRSPTHPQRSLEARRARRR